MQCDYCGATLPDIDFPMVYKELREENGRLEFQRSEVVAENAKLKGDMKKLELELIPYKRGKNKVTIVAVALAAVTVWGMIISSCIASL